MDNENAIKILKHCQLELHCNNYLLNHNCIACDRRKALDMAINALAAESVEPSEPIFIKANIMRNNAEFERLRYELLKQNKNIVLLPYEADLITNVHRPSGVWIKETKHCINDDEQEEYYYTEYHCSNCGEEPLLNKNYINYLTPYCPWCGARMEEE